MSSDDQAVDTGLDLAEGERLLAAARDNRWLGKPQRAWIRWQTMNGEALVAALKAVQQRVEPVGNERVSREKLQLAWDGVWSHGHPPNVRTIAHEALRLTDELKSANDEAFLWRREYDKLQEDLAEVTRELRDDLVQVEAERLHWYQEFVRKEGAAKEAVNNEIRRRQKVELDLEQLQARIVELEGSLQKYLNATRPYQSIRTLKARRAALSVLAKEAQRANLAKAQTPAAS